MSEQNPDTPIEIDEVKVTSHCSNVDVSDTDTSPQSRVIETPAIWTSANVLDCSFASSESIICSTPPVDQYVKLESPISIHSRASETVSIDIPRLILGAYDISPHLTSATRRPLHQTQKKSPAGRRDVDDIFVDVIKLMRGEEDPRFVRKRTTAQNQPLQPGRRWTEGSPSDILPHTVILASQSTDTNSNRMEASFNSASGGQSIHEPMAILPYTINKRSRLPISRELIGCLDHSREIYSEDGSDDDPDSNNCHFCHADVLVNCSKISFDNETRRDDHDSSSDESNHNLLTSDPTSSPSREGTSLDAENAAPEVLGVVQSLHQLVPACLVFTQTSDSEDSKKLIDQISTLSSENSDLVNLDAKSPNNSCSEFGIVRENPVAKEVKEYHSTPRFTTVPKGGNNTKHASSSPQVGFLPAQQENRLSNTSSPLSGQPCGSQLCSFHAQGKDVEETREIELNTEEIDFDTQEFYRSIQEFNFKGVRASTKHRIFQKSTAHSKTELNKDKVCPTLSATALALDSLNGSMEDVPLITQTSDAEIGYATIKLSTRIPLAKEKKELFKFRSRSLSPANIQRKLKNLFSKDPKPGISSPRPLGSDGIDCISTCATQHKTRHKSDSIAGSGSPESLKRKSSSLSFDFIKKQLKKLKKNSLKEPKKVKGSQWNDKTQCFWDRETFTSALDNHSLFLERGQGIFGLNGWESRRSARTFSDWYSGSGTDYVGCRNGLSGNTQQRTTNDNENDVAECVVLMRPWTLESIAEVDYFPTTASFSDDSEEEDLFLADALFSDESDEHSHETFGEVDFYTGTSLQDEDNISLHELEGGPATFNKHDRFEASGKEPPMSLRDSTSCVFLEKSTAGDSLPTSWKAFSLDDNSEMDAAMPPSFTSREVCIPRCSNFADLTALVVKGASDPAVFYGGQDRSPPDEAETHTSFDLIQSTLEYTETPHARLSTEPKKLDSHQANHILTRCRQGATGSTDLSFLMSSSPLPFACQPESNDFSSIPPIDLHELGKSTNLSVKPETKTRNQESSFPLIPESVQEELSEDVKLAVSLDNATIPSNSISEQQEIPEGTHQTAHISHIPSHEADTLCRSSFQYTDKTTSQRCPMSQSATLIASSNLLLPGSGITSKHRDVAVTSVQRGEHIYVNCSRGHRYPDSSTSSTPETADSKDKKKLEEQSAGQRSLVKCNNEEHNTGTDNTNEDTRSENTQGLRVKLKKESTNTQNEKHEEKVAQEVNNPQQVVESVPKLETVADLSQTPASRNVETVADLSQTPASLNVETVADLSQTPASLNVETVADLSQTPASLNVETVADLSQTPASLNFETVADLSQTPASLSVETVADLSLTPASLNVETVADLSQTPASLNVETVADLSQTPASLNVETLADLPQTPASLIVVCNNYRDAETNCAQLRQSAISTEINGEETREVQVINDPHFGETEEDAPSFLQQRLAARESFEGDACIVEDENETKIKMLGTCSDREELDANVCPSSETVLEESLEEHILELRATLSGLHLAEDEGRKGQQASADASNSGAAGQGADTSVAFCSQ